jgi:hypothetical protein
MYVHMFCNFLMHFKKKKLCNNFEETMCWCYIFDSVTKYLIWSLLWEVSRLSTNLIPRHKVACIYICKLGTKFQTWVQNHMCNRDWNVHLGCLTCEGLIFVVAHRSEKFFFDWCQPFNESLLWTTWTLFMPEPISQSQITSQPFV